ncbi:DNA primase [Acidovorax phage ACP17]|uniref:DNA primase/helicase n=1 Tax=Acidovorax phage ACP17 TaxID=2010329 RepID=A0A218M2Z5_9CAUD|nr:DNA primase [Acidovorax phage ACP17]ASD50415.1 DNA primase/helicase [Acidovorax phage ACP17]
MSWFDTKYISLMSVRLERYKQTGPTTHTFRCPYCGDSQSKKSKTRGYFYPVKDAMRFKCHNCGASRSIRDFIKEICPDLYRGYLFDYFGRAEKPETEVVPSEFKTANMSARFKKKEEFLSNFKAVAALPEDNPGRAYIEGRMIPEKWFNSIYYVEDANDVFSRLEAYKHKTWKQTFDAVMVPFHSREEDGFKLMYVQLRFLGEDPPIRYLTLEVDGGHKAWGLDRIDPTKRVYILEGAFDAMFVDNAVACAGSDITALSDYFKEIGCDDVVAVWDSDFATNADVNAKLVAAVNKGMPVVLTGPGLPGKDINAAVKNGFTPDSVMPYLASRQFDGLSARLELTKFKAPSKPTKGINARTTQKKVKQVPTF